MTTRLKVLRAEHDLTQAELAEALGTTQKVISAWETGRVNPRPAMMQKVNELQVDGKLGTINDLKDFNFELIVNMCDLLGLESLYLGIDTDESD